MMNLLSETNQMQLAMNQVQLLAVFQQPAVLGGGITNIETKMPCLPPHQQVNSNLTEVSDFQLLNPTMLIL